MKKVCIKISKIIWIVAAIAVILYAILFGVLRAATPFLEKYQQQIIAEINKFVPYQITISDLSISWYHFSPVIEVDNIKISQSSTAKTPFLTIDEAYVGLDLIKLIKNHQVVPNKIIAKGTTIILPGSVLNKLKQHDSKNKLDLSQYQSYLKQASILDEVILKDVTVQLVEKDQRPSFIYSDLMLEKSGSSYKLQGSVAATNNPATIDFMANIKPNLNNLVNSKIQSYLEISSLNLAEFKKQFSINIPVSAHLNNAKIWFQYENQQIDYAATETTLTNLDFQTKQLNTLKPIPEISLNAIYHKKGNQQQLAINQLYFSNQKNNISALVQLTQDSDKKTVELYAQKLNLNTKTLLQYISLSNKTYAQDLKTLSPNVTIDKTRDSFTLNNNKIESYQVSGIVNLTSVNPLQKSPGATNTILTFAGNQNKGTTNVQFNNSIIKMPWLFRAPIELTKGYGDFAWQRMGERWMLSADNTYLQLPQGDATPTMKLFIGGNKLPRLELIANAEISGLTQKQIYGYLPIAIMPKPVTQWLDQALVKIGKGHAQLILRGNITKFPFDKQDGLFLITAQLQGAKLHYYDNWPEVDNLSGDLTFKNRSMQVDIKTGETAGVVIDTANATIPYMGSNAPVTLTVAGKGHGTLGAGIQYLQQSPLGTDLAELDQIRSQGNFNLNLNLTIPIANQKNTNVLAKGNATISNGELQYSNVQLALSKINGVINFANDDISSDKVTGYLGDKPITISLEPVKKNKQTIGTQINLTTQLTIDELNHYFSNKIPSYITGGSKFTASMVLDKTKGNTLALASDLKGVAITLPSPLGKNANQSSAFDLLLHDVNDNTKQLILDYQNTLSANIFVNQQKNKKFQISKGTITMGGATSTMPTNGINISVKLPNVDVTPWINWYQKNASQTGGTNVMLNSAQISIDNFTFAGQALHNLTVTYKPYSNQSLFAIASDEVAGNINLPQQISSSNPINASFSKLYLTTSGTSSKSSGFKLNQYYNVDFTCKDCRINKTKLGAVKATVRNTNNSSLNISSLNLSSSAYNFTGTANWTQSGNKTSVSGSLFSGNTSKMLADFAIPADVSSNNATVDLDVNWIGAPTAFNISSLNGAATVNAKEGSIEGLNKSTTTLIGLGNVLTALNLESLPGRLSQGISGQNKGTGFYFKKLYGKFNIQNGNLLTQSAYLDGTVAYISMTGRIGLAAKDYNLMMTVIPHLTSSLPVIATIAGGPIIGAATWVVDKAVSPAVDQVTKYNYAITGSWNNPQVKKVQGQN